MHLLWVMTCRQRQSNRKISSDIWKVSYKHIQAHITACNIYLRASGNMGTLRDSLQTYPKQPAKYKKTHTTWSNVGFYPSKFRFGPKPWIVVSLWPGSQFYQSKWGIALIGCFVPGAWRMELRWSEKGLPLASLPTLLHVLPTTLDISAHAWQYYLPTLGHSLRPR